MTSGHRLMGRSLTTRHPDTARPSVARMHAMYTHMYMFLSFRTVSLIVMSSYLVAELRLSLSTLPLLTPMTSGHRVMGRP